MIDFHFIEQFEGFSCTGEVPDPCGSDSGVTIAYGFDLGSHTEQELQQGLSPTLVHKLLPYLGLKQQEAVNTLHKIPLQITQPEAKEIHHFICEQVVARLKTQWHKTAPSLPFEALPAECQTVIASVAYQYGNLATQTPNFWYQCTSGDWDDAYNNLMNFGDNYPIRRKKEAYLLGRLLGKSSP